MKAFQYPFVALLLAALCGVGRAQTITIGSYVGTTAPAGLVNTALKWTSSAGTGAVVANTSAVSASSIAAAAPVTWSQGNVASTVTTYTTTYTGQLAGAAGALKLICDDLCAVSVNGTIVVPITTQAEANTLQSFTIPATAWVNGLNTVSIAVTNTGGPTGVNFALAVTQTSNPTPTSSCANQASSNWWEIAGSKGNTAVVPAGTTYMLGSGACTVATSPTTLNLATGNLAILQTAAAQSIPVTNANVTPSQVNTVLISGLVGTYGVISNLQFSFTPAGGATVTCTESVTGPGISCK
jgi:hypothetical protein